MTNSEKSPVFVDSTLKVVATEDIDITKELSAENTQNLTIEDLLISQDEKKQQ